MVGNLFGFQALNFDLFKKADAQVQTPQLLQRGRDTEVYDLGSGQMKLVTGLPPYTWDAIQKRWTPHVFTDYGNNTVSVQSGMIGWRIGPSESLIYDANMTQIRAHETWQTLVAGVPVPKTFLDQTVVNNSTGVFITNRYTLTYQSYSFLNIYIQTAVWDGRATERNVWITGLPTSLNSLVRVERQWSGIDADTAVNDGVTDSITSTNKLISQGGTGSYTEFRKGGNLVIHENLKTAGPLLKDVQYSNSLTKFGYGGWLSSDSLQLKDDTYSNPAPTDDQDIFTNNASGTACPSTTYTKENGDVVSIKLLDSNLSNAGGCIRAYFQWSTTAIPVGSTITTTTFKYDVGSVSGTPGNCDYMPMSSQPFTNTASGAWTDIGDGIPYVSNDATCKTSGQNKSVTLGSSANTDLQNNLSAGWFAVGVKFNSETRTAGTTRLIQINSQDHLGATPKPTLEVVYTPPTVTQPIQLSNGSGSDTFATVGVSATISCTGGGGTHNGNPATQNFTCNQSVTVTVALPSPTSTVRWMWSDGTTTNKSFTSCASGTCTTQSYTYYKQLAITITPSGLDSNRNVQVTRVQAAASGPQNIPGATATGVWGDQGSTLTVDTTSIVVTANQERFQSYNSTAQRTVTVSSAQSKTYVYQHEFNQLFRMHETHLGDIFSPMPLGTYTGTVTTANGTALSLTMNAQNTDDYLEPSGGRIWVKNGTASWSNMTWRGIIANSTGSQSITSYGNFDIQSAVKHYGFTSGNYHFRYGVDSGTTTNLVFDILNAKLTFSGTASPGQRTVILEYLPSLYTGVQSITVNNVAVPVANYTITSDNTLSPPVSVLTINNVHFSTDSFVIVLQAAATGGGMPSGGGGGSGGSGGSSSIFPINPPTGSALAFSVDLAPYMVSPGASATNNIKIEWQGATKIIITDIHFAKHPEWFKLGQNLPYAAIMSASDYSMHKEIPLTVTVPADVQGTSETVDMTITAITGGSQATKTLPVNITFGSTSDFAVYTGIGLVAVIGIVIAAKRRR